MQAAGSGPDCCYHRANRIFPMPQSSSFQQCLFFAVPLKPLPSLLPAAGRRLAALIAGGAFTATFAVMSWLLLW